METNTIDQQKEAELYFNKANLELQQQQYIKAEEYYHKAIELNSENTSFYNNLGVCFKYQKQFEKAEDAYQKALAIDANNFNAYHNLAEIFILQKKYSKAVQSCQKALELNPDDAETFNNLGVIFYKQKKYLKAEMACERSLAIKSNLETYYNLANIFFAQKNFTNAINLYQHIINNDEKNLNAYNNLGVCFKYQHKYFMAEKIFRQLLKLDPDNPNAHNNLGDILQQQNRIKEAEKAFRKALTLAPQDPEIHLNLAYLLLLIGNFKEGWQEFEWRWQQESYQQIQAQYQSLPWDGSNLQQKTILIYGEQGYGDIIQFVRYVPLLKVLGANVILVCYQSLRKLFQTLEGVDQLITVGKKNLPHYDTHASVMSLPYLFKTNLQTIPHHIPYLKVDLNLHQEWGKRLSFAVKKYRIGLVWSGNLNHQNNLNRSLKLSELIPILQNKNIDFFSLQIKKTKQEQKILKQYKVVDLGLKLNNFAETAAVLSHLDLLITVDTSIAHLAGAIGQPLTWLLLPFAPDFRWLMNREDSPWYSSIQIFRQTELQKWSNVILKIKQRLKNLHHYLQLDDKK